MSMMRSSFDLVKYSFEIARRSFWKSASFTNWADSDFSIRRSLGDRGIPFEAVESITTFIRDNCIHDFARLLPRDIFRFSL